MSGDDRSRPAVAREDQHRARAHSSGMRVQGLSGGSRPGTIPRWRVSSATTSERDDRPCPCPFSPGCRREAAERVSAAVGGSPSEPRRGRSGLAVRVLDPASEASLLVVRACLELRRTDPVILRNWRAAVEKFERDRQEQAARGPATGCAARAAEVLDDSLADDIAEAVFGSTELRAATASPPADTQGAGRAPHLQRPRGAPAQSWARSCVGGRRREQPVLHLPRPWSRHAAGGGCVVAMLGVDGSGKSTVVGSLRSWLGAELDVMPMYFGTGDGRPSLLLLPFKLLVPARPAHCSRASPRVPRTAGSRIVRRGRSTAS